MTHSLMDQSMSEAGSPTAQSTQHHSRAGAAFSCFLVLFYLVLATWGELLELTCLIHPCELGSWNWNSSVLRQRKEVFICTNTVQSSSSTLLAVIKSLKMKLKTLDLWAGLIPTSPAPHKASRKGHLPQLFSTLLLWAGATLFPMIPNCSSSRDWWIDSAGRLFKGLD